jgi:hypothetical protein
LLAKDIRVSNGGLINLSYNEVELQSVYGIYDKATDKMSVHVPIAIAARASVQFLLETVSGFAQRYSIGWGRTSSLI